MNYKALMLDVDGTLVPYDYNALPSDKVVTALQRAEEKVQICFVTGRSYPFVKPIIDKIALKTGFAVLNNGAQVVNLKTMQLLYNQPIDQQDVQQIMLILDNAKILYDVKQDLYYDEYRKNMFTKRRDIKDVSMFFTAETYTAEQMDEVSRKLSQLPNISIHKSKHKDGFGLNVQHSKATKLHGIEIVFKEIGVDPKEAIAVGDSYNDFALLITCGLKVAMGNAIVDLKEIADYIAPSVDEDGVVDVVERFIIS